VGVSSSPIHHHSLNLLYSDGVVPGDKKEEKTMFDDLPLFRSADPITSVLGAGDVKPRRGSQQALLLAEYAHRDGLTDEEAGLFSGLLSRPKCCYWKRCSELRAKGLIALTGETRLSSAGSAMQVCAITEAGRNALA
jgi:hypothetical protein